MHPPLTWGLPMHAESMNGTAPNRSCPEAPTLPKQGLPLPPPSPPVLGSEHSGWDELGSVCQ